MQSLDNIKKRLGDVQKSFNPQKSTYKILDNVIKGNLSDRQMLMELSKITGYSKYPDELKKEYVSIVNDLKEIIIGQREEEKRKREAETTKELRDLIKNLEIKQSQKEQQPEIKEEPKKEDIFEEKTEEVQEEETELVVEKTEELDVIEESQEKKVDKQSKKNKFLVIVWLLSIVLIVLLLLFY